MNIFVFIHNLSILHLSWSFPPFSSSFAMRAWHPNDKNDSWSRLSSEGTYTQTHSHQFPASSLIWPHLSVKRHRALHTHKEQACQREHSLVWQREGQMAFNHTSSSGHLISSFVCGRDPNRQTTQLFKHPSIESQWCPLLPLSSSANDQTWHCPNPPWMTSPLSTARLFTSMSPLTPYL